MLQNWCEILKNAHVVPPYKILKKSSFECEIIEVLVSDRLHFLTTSDKLKSKPTNRKNSSCKKPLQDQNPPGTSVKGER